MTRKQSDIVHQAQSRVKHKKWKEKSYPNLDVRTCPISTSSRAITGGVQVAQQVIIFFKIIDRLFAHGIELRDPFTDYPFCWECWYDLLENLPGSKVPFYPCIETNFAPVQCPRR